MDNQRKPNIVIITTHDSGRHFGCYGISTVQTPAIDSLASDGVKLTNMFATSSICSPSRGSLLTGQYPQRNGLMGLTGQKWRWEFKDYHRHLSYILHDEGYETAFIGVQDEVTEISNLKFDTVFSGNNESATKIAENFAEYVTNRNSNKPFYTQIGFFETHTPYNGRGADPDMEKGVTIPEQARIDQKNSSVSTKELKKHYSKFQGALKVVDQAVNIIR